MVSAELGACASSWRRKGLSKPSCQCGVRFIGCVGLSRGDERGKGTSVLCARTEVAVAHAFRLRSSSSRRRARPRKLFFSCPALTSPVSPTTNTNISINKRPVPYQLVAHKPLSQRPIKSARERVGAACSSETRVAPCRQSFSSQPRQQWTARRTATCPAHACLRRAARTTSMRQQRQRRRGRCKRHRRRRRRRLALPPPTPPRRSPRLAATPPPHGPSSGTRARSLVASAQVYWPRSRRRAALRPARRAHARARARRRRGPTTPRSLKRSTRVAAQQHQHHKATSDTRPQTSACASRASRRGAWPSYSRLERWPGGRRLPPLLPPRALAPPLQALHPLAQACAARPH